MSRDGRKTGGGSRKGRPNKATADVRAAIAAFAEGNVGKLQAWLDAVAEKDPAKAADLFIRVLEYHVPKLARTEVKSDGGADTAPHIRIEFVNSGAER